MLSPKTSIASALTLVLAQAVSMQPLSAQDVVWSTLPPGPSHTFAKGAQPLASGRVLGVRVDFTFFTATDWFVLSPAAVQIATGALPTTSLTYSSTHMSSDGAGGAYLLLSERLGSLGGPSLGGEDLVVLHFNGEGQLTWTRRFGGDSRDVGHDILADGAGGFYLAGETLSSDFGTPTGFSGDGFVARVDGAGSILWVERHGESSGAGRMDCLAADGVGGVLVGGSLVDDSSFPSIAQGFARGYTRAGALLYSHMIHPFGGMVLDIERTSNGYVELAHGPFGDSYCTGRDGTGLATWSVNLSPSLTTISNMSALARRSDGTYLLAGTLRLPTTTQHIRAFADGGTVLWDRDYPVPSGAATVPTTLALDGEGGLMVSGSTLLGTTSANLMPRVDRVLLESPGAIGCAGQVNSTGAAARTRTAGSGVRSINSLTVFTDDAPPQAPGFFLGSPIVGFVPGAGGGQGDLCLGGAIGRFSRPGEVQTASDQGRFHLRLELGSLPTPTGAVSAMAGQTWHFQSWYRDVNPMPTSNFSGSAIVTLM